MQLGCLRGSRFNKFFLIHAKQFFIWGSVFFDCIYMLVKSFITSLTPISNYIAAYNGSCRGTKAITTFAGVLVGD
jgi:hypothetical protein